MDARIDLESTFMLNVWINTIDFDLLGVKVKYIQACKRHYKQIQNKIFKYFQTISTFHTLIIQTNVIFSQQFPLRIPSTFFQTSKFLFLSDPPTGRIFAILTKQFAKPKGELPRQGCSPVSYVARPQRHATKYDITQRDGWNFIPKCFSKFWHTTAIEP